MGVNKEQVVCFFICPMSIIVFFVGKKLSRLGMVWRLTLHLTNNNNWPNVGTIASSSFQFSAIWVNIYIGSIVCRVGLDKCQRYSRKRFKVG